MTKNDFISICSDRQFWKTITTRALVSYGKLPDKKELLKSIYKKIQTRNYYPTPPKEYLTINKGHGVLRIVPVLSLDDICVYYYCVRKLEKYIAVNHISGTYGGYGLSGKLRRVEEDELKKLKEDAEILEIGNKSYIFKELDGYPELTTFKPAAWFAEWGDFTNKLYFNSGHFKNGFVADLDISNFYDSISLDNLEFKIRRFTPSKLNEVVYLLFHLLRFWNRHINFYRQQGVGVPQDLFGECSRILANFYLQDYDRKISTFCLKKGGKYFRYADDQVIFTKNKVELEEAIVKASSLLMREGLNFNQKKVNIMTIKQFRKYFTFENFIKLGKSGKSLKLKTIETQIKFYLKNKHTIRKGGITLLKKILKVIIYIKKRPKGLVSLKKYLLSADFLVRSPLNDSELQTIYSVLNKREKIKFINYFNKTIDQCFYSFHLYNLRKFYRLNKMPIKKISQRISYLKKFYDFERTYFINK